MYNQDNLRVWVKKSKTVSQVLRRYSLTVLNLSQAFELGMLDSKELTKNLEFNKRLAERCIRQLIALEQKRKAKG
jgi:hypothetical protein